MTTPGFISKQLSQTLVYWANPVNNGYGSYTFSAPVEIPGRCEFRTERVLTDMGEEVLSKAFIYLDQEVRAGEYLYLGSLDDSDVEGNTDPKTIAGAMYVLTFLKIPRLGSATEFIYKAYVNTLYRS